MSTDTPFTKENLTGYLKELGKEFRKLNGTKIPVEIVLVGGAAILVNYGFREMTYDVDALITSSSVMKEAIHHVGDRLGLPIDWINTDFMQTASFSERLFSVSTYYRTFFNIITVRTVNAEYLIAMKLMSGRQYKNDLSDIIGILWEHQKNEAPILRKSIDKAVSTLYGEDVQIPSVSQKTLVDAFANGNLEQAYGEIRKAEMQSKDILLDFDHVYPGELKGESVNDILEQARKRRREN